MNINFGSSARRRLTVGAVAVLAVAGLGAATAPIALSAGGDNVSVGDAIQSDLITKKDRMAVINADGSIARGKGVDSVSHTAGSGAYIVFFNKNVRNCAYTATIGLGGESGTSARGFITTVGAAAGETGVFVTTDDIAGSPADRGFHLNVSC